MAIYQKKECNGLIDNMSRPKLDLTESCGGSIHHLTVQFSEFDITTFRPAFGIPYK